MSVTIICVAGGYALVNEKGERYVKHTPPPASSWCDPWPGSWHSVGGWRDGDVDHKADTVFKAKDAPAQK